MLLWTRSEGTQIKQEVNGLRMEYNLLDVYTIYSKHMVVAQVNQRPHEAQTIS